MKVTSIPSISGHVASTPTSASPSASPSAPAPVQVAGPALVPTDAPATAGPRFTRDQLAQAVTRANESLSADGSGSVRFAVHEGTHRIIVRIVDPKSMEVIREFPDSTFLDMMAKLQELSGMQVDVQT